MSAQVRAAVVVALLAGIGACDKAKDPGAGGAATGAASDDPRGDVVAAWNEGGLEVSTMTAATAFGPDCQSGTVGAIDVALCEFPSAAEAQAAEDAALAWVGESTGAARVSGRVLIGIADRRKSDPSGRTINQLIKLTPP